MVKRIEFCMQRTAKIHEQNQGLECLGVLEKFKKPDWLPACQTGSLCTLPGFRQANATLFAWLVVRYQYLLARGRTIVNEAHVVPFSSTKTVVWYYSTYCNTEQKLRSQMTSMTICVDYDRFSLTFLQS